MTPFSRSCPHAAAILPADLDARPLRRFSFPMAASLFRLAKPSYESWVIRRTSATGIKVLYAGTACGAGDVLVPLPWDAELLDEPVSRAVVAKVAWFVSTINFRWPGATMLRPRA